MVRRGERNSSSPTKEMPCLDKNSHEMVRGVPPFPGSNKKCQRRQHTRLLEGSQTAVAGNEEEAGRMYFESTCRRRELPLHPI